MSIKSMVLNFSLLLGLYIPGSFAQAQVQYIEAPSSVGDFSYTFRLPPECIVKSEKNYGKSCLKWSEASSYTCAEPILSGNRFILNNDSYYRCIYRNLTRVNAQLVHPEGIIHKLVNATNYMIDQQSKLETEVLARVSATVQQQIQDKIKTEIMELLRSELRRDSPLRGDILDILKQEGVLK